MFFTGGKLSVSNAYFISYYPQTCKHPASRASESLSAECATRRLFQTARLALNVSDNFSKSYDWSATMRQLEREMVGLCSQYTHICSEINRVAYA